MQTFETVSNKRWEKFRQTQLLCLTELLPPFISQTLRDGTPHVQMCLTNFELSVVCMCTSPKETGRIAHVAQSNLTLSSVTSYILIDLFRPLLIVSSKVFQVVLVHLVYNSALFLASYCSFLSHILANFICIFSGTRQLVLL